MLFNSLLWPGNKITLQPNVTNAFMVFVRLPNGGAVQTIGGNVLLSNNSSATAVEPLLQVYKSAATVGGAFLLAHESSKTVGEALLQSNKSTTTMGAEQL
uniref:hypothetical protein n=1 Tax=uncultured Draconibacterium sp. TaxID=1573823 RepID=UPI00321700D6